MSKSQKKLRHLVAPNKLVRAIALRSREGRSQSRDSSQFKQSSSSQDSGSFTKNTNEYIYNTGGSNISASELLGTSKHEQDDTNHARSHSGHSRSQSGPQCLSRLDTFEKMAQNLEGVTKAVTRLHQKNSEVLQRQRTIENRALNIGDYQKISASKLHKSLTDLVAKVDGLENELRGMRVLWLCSRAKKSQVAMLMFSQGLLSKYDKALIPSSQLSIVDQAKALQMRCKMNPSLLVFMVTSLLNLILALCRARVRSLPVSVNRALRYVQEVCKATCFISLGAMWDIFRDVLLLIVKWLGWRFL